MPRPSNEVPSLRRHKPTNQAVCTVRLANGSRKDIYLGPWKSALAKQEYGRVIALVGANNGIYPDASVDLTVNEAMVRYVKFIDRHYIDRDGVPTGTAAKLKFTLGYLKRLYGTTPLAEFGPIKLKSVRQVMIGEKFVRTMINKFMGQIRQFFKWCVEEEMVGATILESLRAVRPLSIGRSGVEESTPREPADPAAVEKALPFMSPAVRAIVQLLRLTGSRPTEILTMKPDELDRSGPIWKFTPPRHKLAWKGKTRIIYIGPDAQSVLMPWLLGTAHDVYIFSPERSEEIRSRERSALRKTPKYPSHMARNERKRVQLSKRKRPPTECYDHMALSRAVHRACTKAKVKHFSPYCLRHLRAVELREKYGLEVVRATLGQSAASMADHYSRKADEVLASNAAKECG